MKLIKSVNFWMVVFGLGAALSASAARETGIREGGVDGGGGGLTLSSPQEVRLAVKSVFEDIRQSGDLSRSKNNWVNLVPMVSPSFFDERLGREINLYTCLTAPILCATDKEKEELLSDPEKEIYTSAWDYLKLSEIYFEEKGACPAPDKTNAAASVSEYKVGAKICFSIPLIQQTSSVGLKAQVASLVFHEMVHLMGYGEDLAVKLQFQIFSNFSMLNLQDGKFLLYRLLGNYMSVGSALLNAKFLSNEQDRSRAYYLLGMANGMLDSIESVLPDGINDNTIPVKHPEQFESIQKMLRSMVNENFRLMEQSVRMSDAQFDAEIDRLLIVYNQNQTIFEEYLGHYSIKP
jgi:hypothetical protein